MKNNNNNKKNNKAKSRNKKQSKTPRQSPQAKPKSKSKQWTRHRTRHQFSRCRKSIRRPFIANYAIWLRKPGSNFRPHWPEAGTSIILRTKSLSYTRWSLPNTCASCPFISRLIWRTSWLSQKTVHAATCPTKSTALLKSPIRLSTPRTDSLSSLILAWAAQSTTTRRLENWRRTANRSKKERRCRLSRTEIWSNNIKSRSIPSNSRLLTSPRCTEGGRTVCRARKTAFESLFVAVVGDWLSQGLALWKMKLEFIDEVMRDL